MRLSIKIVEILDLSYKLREIAKQKK